MWRIWALASLMGMFLLGGGPSRAFAADEPTKAAEAPAAATPAAPKNPSPQEMLAAMRAKKQAAEAAQILVQRLLVMVFF